MTYLRPFLQSLPLCESTVRCLPSPASSEVGAKGSKQVGRQRQRLLRALATADEYLVGYRDLTVTSYRDFSGIRLQLRKRISERRRIAWAARYNAARRARYASRTTSVA